MSKIQLNLKEKRDADLAISASAFNVHDELKSKTLQELKDLSLQDRLPWHTVCLNVTGDLNVGTIIRTSHCLGASSVTIFGRQRIDNRSIVGSENYIQVNRIKALNEDWTLNVDIFKNFLEENRLTPIFVEGGGSPIQTVDWQSLVFELNKIDSQLCLIMGNETGGIPDNFIELKNQFKYSSHISIPQHGVIRSLNVAVAHAIVSWHISNEVSKWK